MPSKRVRIKPEYLGLGGILLATILISLGIREFANARIHESIASEKQISLRNADLAVGKERDVLGQFPQDGVINPYQMRAEAEQIGQRHINRTKLARLGASDHRAWKVQSLVSAVVLGVCGVAIFVFSLVQVLSGPYKIVQPYQHWRTNGFLARRLRGAAAKWQT